MAAIHAWHRQHICCVLQVSYMELYNEELTDLLSIDNDKEKRLRLLEDRSGVVVQGLEEMVVKSAAGATSADRGVDSTQQRRLQ